MNAERLVELASYLLDVNNRLKLGARLDALHNSLEALTGNPGDASLQTNVSNSLQALENSFTRLHEELTPARIQTIREIGGGPYFTSALPAGIRSVMNSNAVTPSVVRDRVSKIRGDRATYIQRLEEANRGLGALGIEPIQPSSGSAEIGFLIPRIIFNNSLQGLASEFGQLYRTISVFSELATGSVEEVELKEISASDPLVFLGMDVKTVALLAGSITWLLNTWKQGLEIRKIYTDGKAAGLPTKILNQMQKHVQDTLDYEISKHAEELAGEYSAQVGRGNELLTATKFALRTILAKIERGMTVEVRFLPPPPSEPSAEVEGEDGAQGAPAELTPEGIAFERLAELEQSLSFPAIRGEPLIPLEPPPADRPNAAATG